jgi:hypothetical protein
VDLAVVGLKIESEHEDACCLTLEIKSSRANEFLSKEPDQIKQQLNQSVSKNARVDFIRIGAIPRNFKGAILVKQLTAEFRTWLKHGN